DCSRLEEAAKGTGVLFRPGLEVIARLQDKISQKETLEELAIPSASWLRRETGETAAAFVDRAGGRFSAGYVLKWARLGYDGKGVCMVSSREEALASIAGAEARKIAVFAEEKIAFRRELAMIAVLSVTGEFKHWPLVVSEQSGGICRKVIGPAV